MINTFKNAKNKNSILYPQKFITNEKNETWFFIQEVNVLLNRLFLQLSRRPSGLISGIIQPLLWLILFGALFQNAPVGLFILNTKYNQFISTGIIIFTAFTGALNAGLPLIFDREFGFLNRLLVSPIKAKDTILISFAYFIITTTILQTAIILIFSLTFFEYHFSVMKTIICIIIVLLITLIISSISIGLALSLPGHIEFLAILVLINNPMLFSSTALAPLSFMPYWLQIIACLNPLTYAIESLRFISVVKNCKFTSVIVQTVWLKINLLEILIILTILTIANFSLAKKVIINKVK
uniref:ABC-2 type transporter n=1 Tax=Sporolithon durum TaxID=48970 RepID=A0A141SD67_9FLOR|nr:ABC-2 type transporter [Sporolithon durum]AMK96235.1 ABC-2 type transporter [Sporolithon durum]